MFCKKSNSLLPPSVDSVVIRGLDSGQDWRQCLDGVDVVVHCAARVRFQNKFLTLTEFRNTNVLGTLNLARQSIEAGLNVLYL